MTAPEPHPVKTLAVIGAGTMGRGLAQAGLTAGLDVYLADADAEQLRAARAAILARLTKLDLESVPALATGTIEQACAGADLVIEAVFEDLEVKSAVLAAAERGTPAGAVLASNTSGLSITALGQHLQDSSRFVGMHFFNPVHRMALVEVIPGSKTGAATVATACAFTERLGKTPVVVSDSPGFLASRLNCMLGNEALTMLQENVAAPEAIDTAAKLGLNHPMGPLELLDLVGLDVRLAALRTLRAAYGERFAPTRIHEQLVEQGRLGVKTRAGIYDYDERGKRAAP
jgi:3-hydroxybutyryl-CoA dehydrogenase